jgi:hypothetical protein
MKFSLWLETRDSDAKAAVLGVLPAPLMGGPEEDSRLMNSRPTDFSNEVVQRLKNLGLIQSLQGSNPTLWSELVDGISKGTVTIGELIDKLQGV